MRRTDPGSDLLDWAVSMGRLAGAATLVAAARLAAAARGPEDAGAAAAEPRLDAIRQAAAERLNGTARGLFRLGDHLQRGMVDTVAGFAEHPPVEPAAAAAWAREILARATTRRRGEPPRWEEEDDDAARGPADA